jgi:hypothetical protein
LFITRDWRQRDKFWLGVTHSHVCQAVPCSSQTQQVSVRLASGVENALPKEDAWVEADRCSNHPTFLSMFNLRPHLHRIERVFFFQIQFIPYYLNPNFQVIWISVKSTRPDLVPKWVGFGIFSPQMWYTPGKKKTGQIFLCIPMSVYL